MKNLSNNLLEMEAITNATATAILNNIENRMNFIKRNLQTIEAWLEENVDYIPDVTEAPETTTSQQFTTEGQNQSSSTSTSEGMSSTIGETTTNTIETTTSTSATLIASISVLITAIGLGSMI